MLRGVRLPQQPPADAAKRSAARRVLRIVLPLAIVAAAFVVVLPRLADYGEVWGQVRELDASAISLLAAATLLNLVTFAPPWMVALPGLGFRRAFLLTQASTASTYVAPGGAAVGIATAFLLLRALGFDSGAIAIATALTGAWNQLALLGFPPLALGLLTLTGGRDPLLETVGFLGLTIFFVAIVAFALALASDPVAYRLGAVASRLARFVARVARRREVRWSAEHVVRFRHRTIGLLRLRWLMLTAATIAGQLTVFVVLLTALRTLGVPSADVSVVEAFAGWSIVRLLGSVPLTPGGIGLVEVGLTTSLIGFGGERSAVVATVLVYRFLTVVPTLVLGLAAGATWRSNRPQQAA